MTDVQVINRPGSSSKVILGVDDAPENLVFLEAVVRAGGYYPFIGARSGTEGLRLLTRLSPSLVLLDVEMPDMDGFETCRRIRENAALRSVPIVFLTARKTSEDLKKCLGVGGNDFIIKPFDTVKLLERIQYWSARRATALSR